MVETPKNDIENTNGVLDMFKTMITTNRLTGLENSVIGNEKKAEIEKKAVEGMNKVGDFFKIQIPFLGDLGTLFGTKRPIDLLGTKEERAKNKILNTILKAFNFGDMEEIHVKYIESQLEGIDKEFAKECFKEYKNTENTDIDDEKSSRKICKLEDTVKGMTEEAKTAIKGKIPENFIGLKESLIKSLPSHINKLSLSTVNMVDSSLIITENNEAKIDINKIQANPEEFIDKYLKLTIPLFVKSGEGFIASPNINSDTFAYALFGNLTGEKFFVEAVNLGLEKIPVITTNTTTSGENLENQKLDKLTFDQAKILANKVFGNGPATDLICAMSKNNPAMIVRSIALAKHEGGFKFGLKNEDPNKKSEQINIGTFQISAKKNEIVNKRNNNIKIGKSLLEQYNISYDENYFKEIKTYTEETGDSPEKKAQTDLLVWLGFIQNERGGTKIFEELADNNLSDNEVKELISKKIQGGIAPIGIDVVAQIKTKNTDDYPQLA